MQLNVYHTQSITRFVSYFGGPVLEMRLSDIERDWILGTELQSLELILRVNSQHTQIVDVSASSTDSPENCV